jgi:hypothetical protein
MELLLLFTHGLAEFRQGSLDLVGQSLGMVLRRLERLLGGRAQQARDIDFIAFSSSVILPVSNIGDLHSLEEAYASQLDNH